MPSHTYLGLLESHRHRRLPLTTPLTRLGTPLCGQLASGWPRGVRPRTKTIAVLAATADRSSWADIVWGRLWEDRGREEGEGEGVEPRYSSVEARPFERRNSAGLLGQHITNYRGELFAGFGSSHPAVRTHLGSGHSAWKLENLVGAMATFEGLFVRAELNRWLGGFLGAHPRGLVLQSLAFRASRSLAGGPELMRLHCLRCLWRWHHSPAGYLARDSRVVVADLMAPDNLSVDVTDPGDLAPFGW